MTLNGQQRLLWGTRHVEELQFECKDGDQLWFNPNDAAQLHRPWFKIGGIQFYKKFVLVADNTGTFKGTIWINSPQAILRKLFGYHGVSIPLFVPAKEPVKLPPLPKLQKL